MRLSLAKRIRAAEALKRSLDSQPDLDPVLRSEVDALVQSRLAALRAVARDMSFPGEGPVTGTTPSPVVVDEPEVVAAPPAATEPLDEVSFEELAMLPTPPTVPDPEPGPAPVPTRAHVVARRRPKKGPPYKPAGPSIWKRLGPAFSENLLFVLAAFLLIAGAIYFVSTAWGRWDPDERLLVIVGGLELLGGVLFAAGRMMNKGGQLPEVERVLLIVVAFLPPLALAVTGELLLESALYGILAGLIVLGTGWIAIRAAAGNTDAALARRLPLAVLALAAPGLVAVRLGGFAVGGAFLEAIALVTVIAVGARGILADIAARGRIVGWAPLLLAFTTMVVASTLSIAVSRAGATMAQTVAPIGVAFAGIGAAAALLERGLSKAERLTPNRAAAMLVTALALVITGLFMSFGQETAILATALAGTIVGLRLGLGLGQPRLILPGLVASALAYLFLPAPVREAALAIRDSAKGALGYESQPLPYSFYGIPWLPYVGGMALASLAARRRGKDELAGVLLGWTLSVSAGLMLLALAGGRDLRAPAAVLLSQGALLAILGRVGRDWRLVLGGAIGVYGGVACAGAEYASSAGITVFVLSVLGVVATIPALRHARRTHGDPPPSKETNALTDATLMMAAAIAGFNIMASLTCWLEGRGNPEGTAAFALGFAALAGLAALLGSAYRRPEGGLAATLLLVVAVEALVAPMGAGFAAAFRAPALVLVSLVPVVVFMFGGARIPLMRPGFTLKGFGSWGLPAVSAFVVQALLDLDALHAVATDTVDGSIAGGVLLGGLVVLLAAVLAGRVWAAWAGAIQIALAGPLLAGVFGLDVFSYPGAAGFAATALVLAFAGAEMARRRGPFEHMIRPLLTTASIMVPSLLLWLTLLLADVPRPVQEGWLIGAGLIGAGAGWLVRSRERRGDPVLESRPAGAAGGLLLVLAAFGLLEFLDARAELLAMGLAASAFSILVFDREARRPAMFVAILFALAMGLSSNADGAGGAWLLLGAFVLVTAGGRVLARDWSLGGGILFLLGAMTVFARGLALDVLDLDARWVPAIFVAVTAAMFLAPRVRALAVSPAAVYSVGGPFAGLVGAVTLGMALVIAGNQSHTDGRSWLTDDAPILATTAAAVLALGFSIGTRVRGVMRAIWPGIAAALAIFLFPPLNRLLHLGEIAWWRPDIEMGLVAAGLALAMAPAGLRAVRPTPLKQAAAIPYGLAFLALLLTAGEYREVTTPLAFTAAAIVPFVLLLRDRDPRHADALGAMIMLSAYAFCLYLVPDTGKPPPEILPLLAAVTVVFSVGFLLVARRMRSTPPESPAHLAGSRLIGVAVIDLMVAVAFLVVNIAFLLDTPADAVGVLLAAFSMIGAGAVAAWLAWRSSIPSLAHLPVAAGLTLHAYIAFRTEILSGLDGYNLHLLAAVGATLLVLSRRLPEPMRAEIRIDALLLPLLVVGVGCLDLVDAVDMEGRGALGLFMAAAAYGVAGYRERSPALGWAALGLVNLALFSIWRHRGITDPAFYGVPAGLSLVLGSEVARRANAKIEGAWLLAVGLVITYGSVAVQVLLVREPTHALVLFALGLLAVAWGAWRARNDVLLAGTAAVVVDVVAYLLCNGFARDFVGAGLLLAAGLTVLAGGAVAAKHRRRAAAETSGGEKDLHPEPDKNDAPDTLGPGADAGGEDSPEA